MMRGSTSIKLKSSIYWERNVIGPQTVKIVPTFYGAGGSLLFSQKLATRLHPRKINPVYVLPFSFFKIHLTIAL